MVSGVKGVKGATSVSWPELKKAETHYLPMVNINVQIVKKVKEVCRGKQWAAGLVSFITATVGSDVGS
jgi:hypothetical protein